MKLSVKRYLIAIITASALCLFTFFAVFHWSMHYSNVGLVPRLMAQRQATDTKLLALDSNTNFWGELKLHRIWIEKPDVIMVGSSRGGQFRSRMLRPYTFHNASFTAWTVDQTTNFLTRVTARFVPRVVIVSLDYFMFTDAYADAMERDRMMTYGEELRFERMVWRKFIVSAASRNLNLHPTSSMGHSLVGYDALRLDTGYRWDGSFRYPYRSDAQREIPYDHHAFISAFPGGQKVSEKQLAALHRLADLARTKGFKLVAVQLPILKPATDFIDQDKDFQPYAGVWHDFRSAAMQTHFRDAGVMLFDHSRLPFTNDVKMFYDAVHPNEIGIARSVLELAKAPEFLAALPKLDVESLEADIRAPLADQEPLSIYGMQF